MGLKELEEKKFMLHNIMHNTNVQTPGSRYIGNDKYPAQNALVCLTLKKLKYRNMNIVDRPIQGSELESENGIYEKEFFIIRCDNTEPYIMVGISLDSEMIVLVTDSRNYESIVCQYPLQLEDYIGCNGEIRFTEGGEPHTGFVIRVDHGEPCKAVIVEYVAKDYFHCYTGDEVEFKTYLEFDNYSKKDIVKLFELTNSLPDHEKMLIFL